MNNRQKEIRKIFFESGDLYYSEIVVLLRKNGYTQEEFDQFLTTHKVEMLNRHKFRSVPPVHFCPSIIKSAAIDVAIIFFYVLCLIGVIKWVI